MLQILIIGILIFATAGKAFIKYVQEIESENFYFVSETN